jgi:hypothetical protein
MNRESPDRFGAPAVLPMNLYRRLSSRRANLEVGGTALWAQCALENRGSLILASDRLKAELRIASDLARGRLEFRR